MRLRSLRNNVRETKSTEAYPALNDITDAFEALPAEIVKYFTLYKEIDAKYITQIPLLHHRIDQFRKAPKTPENQHKRIRLIKEVSELLAKMLPCMEEKMHVASIASDRAAKYVDRINDDYELIMKGEIPDAVRFGQLNHPAMINDSKTADNKSAQSQRSESRREALAAKKAANETDGDEGAISASGRGKGRRDRDGTPLSAATTSTTSTTTSKKRKTASNGNYSSVGAGNGAANSGHGNFAGGAANGIHAIMAPTPTVANNGHLPSAHSALSTPMGNSHASLTASNASAALIKSEHDEKNSSRPETPSTKRNRTASKKKQEEDFYIDSLGQKRNSAGEPIYCYCNQVSYGEMVGCDGDDCQREWFHLPCTGLATLPRGKWYCDDCKLKKKK